MSNDGVVTPWQVEPGASLRLDKIDPRSDKGTPGDRGVTEVASALLVSQLGEWQNKLWAEDRRSLLVVLQAMDAGGKDGTISKVFTGVNPQGVKVSSFKAPTPIELEHDFLWRIHAQAPAKGEIGVFNRSHYEDVLIVRVNDLAPESVWRPRYEQIRAFESQLVAGGTTIVKFFLHISKEEQAERFQARLDDPAKRWKFSKDDLEVRERWDDYQDAYSEALEETSTGQAPWFVIPADRKWYRNWAISTVLEQTLAQMDPTYPPEEPGLDDIVIT